MKHFTHSFTLILIAYLLGACSSTVYDDYSKCSTSSGVLLFRYDADGSDNVIDQYITNGRLFIYNEAGTLIHEAELTESELYTTIGYPLPDLEHGTYRVIVWGNIQYSSLADTDKLAQSTLSSNFSSQKNDALYFASDHIVIGSDPIQKVIPFSSAHIDIEVACTNFSKIYGKGLHPVIELTNSGQQYLFDQNGIPLPNQFMDYTLPIVYNETTKKHTSEFNAFRFGSINDITVVVRHPNTNEVLQELLLQEYIKNLTPPVDNRHEQLIRIEFVFTPLGVIIKPPVWEDDLITPDV